MSRGMIATYTLGTWLFLNDPKNWPAIRRWLTQDKPAASPGAGEDSK